MLGSWVLGEHQLSAINPPLTSLERGLREFAQFAAKLKGDEKSEAQNFLFYLLAAFGHDPNTLPEGSTFEYHVRVPGERTRFADFVWPGLHQLFRSLETGGAWKRVVPLGLTEPDEPC